MFRWLRELDEAIFSPPHRFETVLALVSARLGLFPPGRAASNADKEETVHVTRDEDSPSTTEGK